MKVINTVATVFDRFIWMIGVMAILVYAQDHWPFPYRVVTFVLLIGLAAWYLWKFFIQPFRVGLKGDGDRHDA